MPALTDLIDGMPRLIQAGMGVQVSWAKLANVTSRLGALGVVSGVGLRHVVVEQVRAGDPEVIGWAHTFPLRRYVDDLLAYAPGGPKHKAPVPMDDPDPERGALPKRLSAIAAYIEVMRAKAGHAGKVGVNVMWKCATTVIPTIYGALIAGVDALLCGAGVPMELPDIVKRIRSGQNLAYAPLNGTGTHVHMNIEEDEPAHLFDAIRLPKMMPILSNFAFPKRIMDIWRREYDGVRPFAFVLENHTAGGHNAPPRDRVGFTEKDDLDRYFDQVREMGAPIYVAGDFPDGGSGNDFQEWLGRGAYGIQVGSRFALCDESGMRRDLKDMVIAKNASGEPDVQTDNLLSPTGYPFKYVPLEGSLSDAEVYANRKRICNRAYLVHSHFEEQPDGTVKETYICPAMPAKQYQKLGGKEPDLHGRVCLCNALLSTAGLDNHKEPPLVTLGVSGKQVTRRWTARQVMEDILGVEYVAHMEGCLAPS